MSVIMILCSNSVTKFKWIRVHKIYWMKPNLDSVDYEKLEDKFDRVYLQHEHCANVLEYS